MSQSNNTKLLRPFDLEAAKAGARVCHPLGECHIDSVIAADKYNVVGYNDDGSLGMWDIRHLRMAPLGWVEDNPVYPGDILFGLWNGSDNKGFCITGLAENCFCGYGVGTAGYPPSILTRDNDLSWTPRKTKKQGWINIYPEDGYSAAAMRHCSGPYATRELADKIAGRPRIACSLIEWEE